MDLPLESTEQKKLWAMFT